MTMNAETTVNYFVFHTGQMSSLPNAVPNVRESLSLQCSAYEYQVLMQDGHLCSEDLVNCFLDQIERHNNHGLKLNAILSVCPREVAVSQAKALDEERRLGKVRGELHGIPIIIKVRDTLGAKDNPEGLTEMTRTASLQDLPWGWYLRQARVRLHLFKPRGTQA